MASSHRAIYRHARSFGHAVQDFVENNAGGKVNAGYFFSDPDETGSTSGNATENPQ
jgi:hypothetical protein